MENCLKYYSACRIPIPKWDKKEWAKHKKKLAKLAKPKVPKQPPKLVSSLLCNVIYNQTSAQREHDKNMCGFVRSMCITQRKIISNYGFKQCSNKYCLQTIVFLMPFITLRNNRFFYLKIKKKIPNFLIVEVGNISPGRNHRYGKIFINNNV